MLDARKPRQGRVALSPTVAPPASRNARVVGRQAGLGILTGHPKGLEDPASCLLNKLLSRKQE